jgi:hypothetical protein
LKERLSSWEASFFNGIAMEESGIACGESVSAIKPRSKIILTYLKGL